MSEDPRTVKPIADATAGTIMWDLLIGAQQAGVPPAMAVTSLRQLKKQKSSPFQVAARAVLQRAARLSQWRSHKPAAITSLNVPLDDLVGIDEALRQKAGKELSYVAFKRKMMLEDSCPGDLGGIPLRYLVEQADRAKTFLIANGVELDSNSRGQALIKLEPQPNVIERATSLQGGVDHYYEILRAIRSTGTSAQSFAGRFDETSDPALTPTEIDDVFQSSLQAFLPNSEMAKRLLDKEAAAKRQTPVLNLGGQEIAFALN